MGSYRNDHDAALARASALQDELDRARADDMERERKVAQLEAALAAERAKAASLETALGKRPITEQNVRVEPPTDPRYATVIVIALLVAGIVAGLILALL